MKKRVLALSALFYGFCLVQSTLAGYVEILGIRPNLLIVAAISIALCRKDMESAFMGLLFGFGLDILIGHALGWYAILLFLACFGIGMVNPKLYKENVVILVFFVFFSTAAVELMYYFVNYFLRGYQDMVFVLTTLILPESLYNAVLAVPVYPLIARIYKKLDRFDYVHTRL
ncbi:MAG: rod shape-determining protein MreD [Thermoclostridium sp.]|nr:rod shape-determining protein MreD [Thermoclostridium sp.]